MKKVTKNTKAGRYAKLVQCPDCHHTVIVYGFDFAMLYCYTRERWISKYDLDLVELNAATKQFIKAGQLDAALYIVNQESKESQN